MYIFFLPFALVDSLAWLVTPIVALVSFTLFGIEAIGAEIENPCKLLVLLHTRHYKYRGRVSDLNQKDVKKKEYMLVYF